MESFCRKHQFSVITCFQQRQLSKVVLDMWDLIGLERCGRQSISEIILWVFKGFYEAMGQEFSTHEGVCDLLTYLPTKITQGKDCALRQSKSNQT